MNIYLVGGAVRDQLLHLPVTERDWVVVGATAQQLLEKQFRQVGREFPVFLHPETQEEYALARKERKSAPGYYGFECDFSPEVTLEEDLARRDLTINAMAIGDTGELIDPYHGLADLQNKVLRHISPAFNEDPVRVLRVARFAARFHHLGFHLAEETRQLIYAMVKQGELLHLTPERVWKEWQRSLTEKNPEQFIVLLRACGVLSLIVPELHQLFGVPSTYKHHPEVDSGVHTLMVLEKATALSSDPCVRFAALVHDLGKASTPKSLWPKHYGHEERGVPLVMNLCARLRIPNEYRDLALLASRFHLLIHRITELRSVTIVQTLEYIDAFRRPYLLSQLLLVCHADSAGRAGAADVYPQANQWRDAFAACSKISVQEIIAQGYQGAEIKTKIQQKRVACVDAIRQSWSINEK